MSVNSLRVWSGFRSTYLFPLVALLLCEPGTPFGQPASAAGPKQHRLYIMDADGKNRKQLFSHSDYFAMGSPAMTADGKRIAFDAWQSQNGERSSNSVVFVIKSDGTDLQDLGPGAMPTWSPRGKRIAFTQYSPKRGVFLMRADGAGRRMLDEDGWSAQWSPDGRMIAYAANRGGGNITVYDLAEDEYHSVFVLGQGPYRSIYWNLKWSPDSRRLCVLGRKADGAYEIATVNAWADKPEVRVHLSTKVQPYAGFAWHPDGKRVLFAQTAPELKKRRIFFFDPSKTDEPKLFEEQDPRPTNGDMCWSHDGKQLLYVARDE